MEKNPLISIVIPTYNRAPLIGEALNSILEQTYNNWECFVIDDSSTDNTQEIVQSFIDKDYRIQYHNRPENRLKGANSCRNYGFEISNGLYINWLDSDDLLAKNHLDLLLNAFNGSSNVQATISQALIFFNVPGDSNQKWSNIVPHSNLLAELISSKINWQTASILWLKSFLPVKPFREDLQSSQEWTFHLEQIINKMSYKIVNENTVFVRRHEERIGKDISQKKFKSTFLSRYYIFRVLYDKKLLSNELEYYLLYRMLQAIKSSVKYKYDKLIGYQIKLMIKLLFLSNRKKDILKLIFSIPIYRVTGKGERLFKMNKIKY